MSSNSSIKRIECYDWPPDYIQDNIDDKKIEDDNILLKTNQNQIQQSNHKVINKTYSNPYNLPIKNKIIYETSSCGWFLEEQLYNPKSYSDKNLTDYIGHCF